MATGGSLKAWFSSPAAAATAPSEALFTLFTTLPLVSEAITDSQRNNISRKALFMFKTFAGHTQARGKITGLLPGLHDSTSTHCNSTGPHFNPQNKLHWVLGDEERQAGDLGNIVADQDGIADVCLKDLQILLYQIPLSGPNSILGRVVVVHADPDDLGRGGHELSKSTGNAGAGIGCGKAWRNGLVAPLRFTGHGFESRK